MSASTRVAYRVSRKALTVEWRRMIGLFALSSLFVLLLTAGIVSVNAINPQASAILVGSGDLTLSTPATSEDPAILAQARTLVQKRYGAETKAEWSVLANDLTVVSASAVGNVNYRERDNSLLPLEDELRLLDGTWPSVAGEVIVTKPLAEKMDIDVGDTVTLALGDVPLTVTGIAITRLTHSSEVIHGAPGTWSKIANSATNLNGGVVIFNIEVFVPPESQALILKDAKSSIGKPAYDADSLDTDEANPDESALETALSEAGFHISSYLAIAPDPRPFWVQNASVVTWPALTLVVILVTAQLAVRLRKDRGLAGTLAALGMSRSGIITLLTLLTAVPTTLGAVAGGAIGVVAGGAAIPAVADAADMDPSGRPLPLTVVLTLVVVFVAASALAALALTAWFASRSLATDSSAKFADVSAGPKSIAWPTSLGVTSILLAIAASSFLTGLDPKITPLIVAALVCLGLIGLIPLLLATLSHIRVSALWLRLAIRLSAADRGRVIGIAAVVAFGLAAPLGLSIAETSRASYTAALYLPSTPYGQVNVVLDDIDLSTAQRESLDKAAGVVGTTTYSPQDKEGDGYYAVPAGTDLSTELNSPLLGIVLVPDRAAADTILGWSMSDADWAVLAEGGALDLATKQNGLRPPVSTEQIRYTAVDITTDVYEGGVNTCYAAEGLTLHPASELPNSSARGQGDFVLTTAKAKQLGIIPVAHSLRFTDASTKLDAIVDAAAAIGIPPTRVTLDAGPSNEAPTSYYVSLAASGALVLIVIPLLVSIGARENRGIHTQFLLLGTRRPTIQAAFVTSTMVSVISGAVIGLIAGIGVTTAWFGTQSVPIVIAWNQVALILVAILLISVVVAYVGTRGRLHRYNS